MDIGDIGFLIIAFIVFVVNFIVKANKEKTQTKTQKPAQPELPEPWEVEETLPPIFESPFRREKEFEEKKRQITRIPVPSSQESFESVRKRLQTFQEGTSSLSESLYIEDEVESINYKDDDASTVSYTNELFHGNITEELKKVIIYSEILHRKYE